MSVDHDASLVVGYVVEPTTMLDHLLEGRNKKTHKEKRFCPKTGNRLEDVVVVDRETCQVWAFNGKDYPQDELSELLESIGDKYNCYVFLNGNFMCGDGLVCIESNNLPRQNVDSDSDSSRSFEYINSVKKDLLRIGKALRKDGFKIGELGVHTLLSVY